LWLAQYGDGARLKNELAHHRRYRTRAQAIQEITEYIEIFYNRQRKTGTLQTNGRDEPDK
jgi:hypothetical protein